MELERLLQRTRALQAIPAPPFGEAGRAERLRLELEKAGLADVTLDRVGNVLARIPGGPNPPLVVSAHLDSIFPEDTQLDGGRDDDRLTGPGIGDNAVGLASLVELAYDLPSAEPPPGDIWLVATVGEEGLGNLRGIRQVVARFGSRVTAYIVLEGMALGHVYHRGLPALRLRVSARTTGGHSWIHADRPSAVHTLLEIGSKLLQLPLSAEPRTTLNIGRIAGGNAINAVAAEAWMEIDLRSEQEQAIAELARQVEAVVAHGRQPKVAVQVEEVGSRPGGGLPEQHPLVQAACRALRLAGETACQLEAASTDASWPLSLGLPAVCIGLTLGGGAHSQDEFIRINPLTRGYTALCNLIRLAFELPRLP